VVPGRLTTGGIIVRVSILIELATFLRDPPDALVEQWSRSTAPATWRRIDEHAIDDGWNGTTAQNLRATILREDKDALRKLAEAITVCCAAPPLEES
jgi:hypothetical protein